MGRCGEIWGDRLVRVAHAWARDMGRSGEIWGEMEIEGDMGRHGKMWGDVGRYGETRGDVGCAPRARRLCVGWSRPPRGRRAPSPPSGPSEPIIRYQLQLAGSQRAPSAPSKPRPARRASLCRRGRAGGRACAAATSRRVVIEGCAAASPPLASRPPPRSLPAPPPPSPAPGSLSARGAATGAARRR